MLRLLVYLSIFSVTIQANCQELNRTEHLSTYVGTKVANFNSITLKGDSIKLEDYIGKPILINLWHLRCGACWKEIADFNRIIKQYPEVVILSLMQNPRDEILKRIKIGEENYIIDPPAFKTNSINYEIIPDATTIMENFGIVEGIGFPLNYFIDKDGTIRSYQNGYVMSGGMYGDEVNNYNELLRHLNSVMR